MAAKLAIVTATADPTGSAECRVSWDEHLARTTGILRKSYLVVNGEHAGAHDVEEGWHENAFGLQTYGSKAFLGVVPAFAIGVQKALDDGAEIIACFHDDLLIEQAGWDEEVLRLFKTCPKAGLVGFGGARGLADPNIYQTPYNPMQLARRGFMSNMRDAEAHGARVEAAQPIAVLDGFSQIGRAEFWRGKFRQQPTLPAITAVTGTNLFDKMREWGLIHHAYDAALGAFAKQLGWQVWLAPIRCHHFGGRTAVGNAAYQAWAQGQAPGGDQGFWQQAHRIVYDRFKGILPVN